MGKGDETSIVEESQDGSENSCGALWRVEVILNRPRIRLPDPAITILASGSVNAHNDASSKKHYLPSLRPLEPNVLEPLRGAPGVGSNVPYLPISRLEKVLPVSTVQEHKYRLRHNPTKPIRAVPAIIARMRYTRVNMNSALPTTIACLDVEVIPFVDIQASIEQINMSLAGGRTESLMEGFLPMACQSKDCITFLYRLHQPINEAKPRLKSSAAPAPLANSNIATLSISLGVKVSLSETCTPHIAMDWSTNVDFSQALNPSYGPPSQPIQRPHRPTGLQVNHNNNAAILSHTLSTSLQHPSLAPAGLTISFTAPSGPVQVGKPFTWSVLIVNASDKVAKLTIIPLPRIQRTATQAQHYAKRHAPKSSTASFNASERRHTRNGEEVDVAQAVVDENIVYAMQHSSLMPPETDLMALTAELRVGPLAPAQCHECEIEMVAFKEGSLTVDAMRIVDLVREPEEGAGAQGVVTDIRDLPDIVCVR